MAFLGALLGTGAAGAGAAEGAGAAAGAAGAGETAGLASGAGMGAGLSDMLGTAAPAAGAGTGTATGLTSAFGQISDFMNSPQMKMMNQIRGLGGGEMPQQQMPPVSNSPIQPIPKRQIRMF